MATLATVSPIRTLPPPAAGSTDGPQAPQGAPQGTPPPADSPRVKGASVSDPKACARLFAALERAEVALLHARHAAEATGIVDAWIAVETAGNEIETARRRMLARE